MLRLDRLQRACWRALLTEEPELPVLWLPEQEPVEASGHGRSLGLC